MNGLGSVLEGIGGGYLASLAVYVLLSFLITREGRGILMKDSGMSRVYYLQLGFLWMIAGAAGAAVSLHFLPESALAMSGVACVAGLLCLALLRVRSKVPHQQSLGDTGLLLLCVLAGCAVPVYLRLS